MYDVEVKYEASAGPVTYPATGCTLVQVQTHVTRALAAWGRSAPVDLNDLDAFEARLAEDPEYVHEDKPRGIYVWVHRRA